MWNMGDTAMGRVLGTQVFAHLKPVFLPDSGDYEFVMTCPNGSQHKLLASQTSQERLDAHWSGFVANHEQPTVGPVPTTAFRPSFPNPAVWTDELQAIRSAEYAAFQRTPEGIAEQAECDERFSQWEPGQSCRARH